jgi:hypothetical protein
MGRTSTANKPLPLNNSPKQLSVSWESNPARVKASKNLIFSLNTQNISMLLTMTVSSAHRTVHFGLVRWNSPGFESALCQSLI